MDLDNDNDGILDSVECSNTPDILLVYFNSANYNPNIYSDDVTASASIAGNGLSRTIATTYNYQILSNINASTENDAIAYNEYIEYNITPQKPFAITGVGYFRTPYGLNNNAYHYSLRISDDNFLTSTVLHGDKTYEPGSSYSYEPGLGDVYFDIDNHSYYIQSGKTYKLRVYFYNVTNYSLAIAHDDFKIFGYEQCDYDNDGTPNIFDTDSDGDGCPDALEGGASFTSTNLTDNRLSGAVSSTGIPLQVGSGQSVGSSQNASVFEDCIDTDTDGDGIPDHLDLDDDNDGILDIDEECMGFRNQTSSGTWKGNTSSTLTVSMPGTTSQTNAYSLSDGQVRYHIGQNGGEARRMKEGDVSFTFTFSNPVPMSEIAFYFVDLDAAYGTSSNAAITISVNGSQPNGSLLPIYGAYTESYNATTGTYYSPGAIDDQALLLKGTGNQLVQTITVISTNIDPGDWIAYALFGYSFCDYDSDGTPDHLDLDSDGDGCPDAIEGNENVTSSHLNPDESINIVDNGGIDANGVPNLVNAGGDADTDEEQGQDAGNAYNETLNSCKNYWIGSSSPEWDTASNWTAQEVPLTGEDIEFATIENNNGQEAINDLYVMYGTAKSITEKTIGNLTNFSKKSIIVPPGSSLVVNGRITGSETNPDRIVIEANRVGAVPNGSLKVQCNSNSGKTIKATVELYAKGFKGSTQTWVDNIAGSPTNGLSFSSSYRWQYFGVPVSSVAANPTFYGSFLREYSEPKNAPTSYYNKWFNLTNSSVLTAFKGYAITQETPKIITIKGDLVFCDQDIVLTRSAAAVAGSTDPLIDNMRYGLGQNIFGNSFTAAIPIDKIDFNNILVDGVAQTNDGSLIEKTVYLYNTGSFGQWTSSIQINTSPDATASGSYRAIPANVAGAVYDQIPSMQGFLLRHTGVIDTEITMTLPYGEVTANTKLQTAPRAPLSYLEFELNSASSIDKLWLFSQEGTSKAFDNGWDGRKFFGTPTAFIYAPNEAGNMQVSTVDNLKESLIAFVPNNDTNYTLSIRKSNIDEKYNKLYLHDLIAKKTVALDNDTTHYTFMATEAGSTEFRFIISDIAEQITTGMDHLLKAYTSGSNLHFENQGDVQCTARVFDVSGRLVLTKTIAPLSKLSFNSELERGTYIIKLSADKKEYSNKIVIY